MSIHLHIELFGETAFEYEILNVGKRAMNMSPILSKIAEDWRDRIENQFATEGAVGESGKWTKLAFATIKDRGSAHPILIRNADLFLQATDEQLWRVTDDGIEIDMSEEQERIGGFHQSGTEKMPRRPIIDFTYDDVYRDTNKLEEYLLKGRIHW